MLALLVSLASAGGFADFFWNKTPGYLNIAAFICTAIFVALILLKARRIRFMQECRQKARQWWARHAPQAAGTGSEGRRAAQLLAYWESQAPAAPGM
jgi:hypothetical protein